MYGSPTASMYSGKKTTLQTVLTKNAISYIDDVILWSSRNPDNPDLEFHEIP